MHHNVIIKDGDTTKAVKKVLVDGVQFVDYAPIEGSSNLVSSNGVAKAISDTKEAVDEETTDLQQQIDDIAEKAGSGYIPKGEATVATLNALSGQENGELYTMTDAGTLTDGSVAVVAGDTVAWDATNSVWYKAMDYAPAQYGTNEVHNLATTITAFRTGDVIPVDGPSGTAKMAKDALLAITAQNALGSVKNLTTTATEADLVAGNFLAIDVPGVGGPTKKLPGNCVAPKSVQDKIVSSLAKKFSTSTSYAKNDLCEKDGRLYRFVVNHGAGAWSDDDVMPESVEYIANSEKQSASASLTASTLYANFVMFDGIGVKSGCLIRVRCDGVVNGDVVLSSFKLATFGSDGSWKDISNYIAADGEWHDVAITRDVLLYNGNVKFGVNIPGDRIPNSGTVEIECKTHWERSLEMALDNIENISEEVDVNSEYLRPHTESANTTITTAGGGGLKFQLFRGQLNVGDVVKFRVTNGTAVASQFMVGGFASNGSWLKMSKKAPCDGEWHALAITQANQVYNNILGYGVYIEQSDITTGGTIVVDAQPTYGESIQFPLDELEKTEEVVTRIDEYLNTPELNKGVTMTVGSNCYLFDLFNGALNDGDAVELKFVNGTGTTSRGALGCFASDGSWIQMCDSVPADGEWHRAEILHGNPVYQDKQRYGCWIRGTNISVSGTCTVYIKPQYKDSEEKKFDDLAMDVSVTAGQDHILRGKGENPLEYVLPDAGLCSIFRKFGFIGDSLMSGEIVTGSGTAQDPYQYHDVWYMSYGQIASRLAGIKGSANWSFGGCKTSDWITAYITNATRGYDDTGVLSDSERFMTAPKQAYLIGLGTNDAAQSVAVGDYSDVDLEDPTQNGNSFYGRYARIIQTIKSIQPSAKIFVMTIPSMWSTVVETGGYNDAIRDMATRFTNVFLLDFQKNLQPSTFITNNYIKSGHCNAQGYAWFAKLFLAYVDYVIRSNPTAFQYASLIGDSSDTGGY